MSGYGIVIHQFRVGHGPAGDYIALEFRTKDGKVLSFALPHALADELMRDLARQSVAAARRRED